MFFVDATRSVSDSAARAGTLTYIHTYMCLSLCLRRSIAPSHRSFAADNSGLATGRPDLIFSKLRQAPIEKRPPLAVLHFALALTPRVIGRIIGPVALFSRTLPSSHLNPIAIRSDERKCEADALAGTWKRKRLF